MHTDHEMYSLLELFNGKEFLVLDFGADWCLTCHTALLGTIGSSMAATVPSVWPWIKRDDVSFANVVDPYVTLMTTCKDAEGGTTMPYTNCVSGHPDIVENINITGGGYLHPPCGIHDFYVMAGFVGAVIGRMMYGMDSAYVPGTHAASPLIQDIFGIWAGATETFVLQNTGTHIRIVYQAYTLTIGTDYHPTGYITEDPVMRTVQFMHGENPKGMNKATLKAHPRLGRLKHALGQTSTDVALPETLMASIGDNADRCASVREVHTCSCQEVSLKWQYQAYECPCPH